MNVVSSGCSNGAIVLYSPMYGRGVTSSNAIWLTLNAGKNNGSSGCNNGATVGVAKPTRDVALPALAVVADACELPTAPMGAVDGLFGIFRKIT